MWAIIWIIVSIVLAFIAGALFIPTLTADSCDDMNVGLFIVIMCCLVLSICVSIKETQKYYEEKEWSSVKYNLKKKVITIEEDNTVKLDTVYTFTHK